MLAIGLNDGLEHFQIDLSRLLEVTDRVIATMRARYPTLEVPLHSRWRHFVIFGDDRFQRLTSARTWRDGAERARAAFDLAFVSVLLDAGAGRAWTYRDPVTGANIGRSEGLALASLAFVAGGALSRHCQAAPSSRLRSARDAHERRPCGCSAG